jgi:chaperone modulatory protein CbpM
VKKGMFEITEIAEECHLERTVIQKWIEEEWISPAQPEGETTEDEVSFDREDMARILLIEDLRSQMGVNDEAMPIILHLIDQLHRLRQLMNEKIKTETSPKE